jgi:hypothetical protein
MIDPEHPRVFINVLTAFSHKRIGVGVEEVSVRAENRYDWGKRWRGGENLSAKCVVGHKARQRLAEPLPIPFVRDKEESLIFNNRTTESSAGIG